ncbi:pectinesterase family protein [Mariniflexile litorale]|uniref:Pectinesterase family protein n=1 Tax=Mariniflexile litorale TaxID=3045158 RepID=A0AAU7EKV5_9FLAO|nr:pectinesterase family protein [Mariniflexile sp. KMM 9835]MDQ8210632.1 pectinesterase family protein [Mariniflexile sp. KMM 9835]
MKSKIFSVKENKLFVAFIILFIITCKQITAQTKLADWSFTNEYSVTGSDPVIYKPTETSIGNYAGVITSSSHSIYANFYLGDQGDYYMRLNAPTGKHENHGGIMDVMRIYYDGAFSITDFTNPSNHNNYYEFTFPTTGYFNIELDYTFYGGQSNSDDFIEVVYSIDEGITWADAKTTYAGSGWSTEVNDVAQITAKNKSSVIVRLICVTENTASNNFNLSKFSVSGTSTTIPSNTNSTVSWLFDLGTTNQMATYSDESLWKPDYVSEGSNLSYNGTETGQENSVTFTRFTPTVKSGSRLAVDVVSFNITPLTGLTFAPKNIFFNCERFGTGGGLIDVIWKSSDGALTTIQTGIKPDRKGDDSFLEATYVADIDVSSLSIPILEGEGSLQIYIYSLDPGKSVGIANIKIEGVLNGTIEDIAQYTVTTAVTPLESGVITSDKPTTVDNGSQITLTANRNFGYEFINWTDGADNVISTDNPYTLTVTSDITVKANFNSINTYALDFTANGGAADYMVDISPLGTMVNSSRMYEEGTNVSLAASNNPILNFSNWGTGETNATLSVVMDNNKSVSAEYNALDYIVGWDFYKTGSSGRPADFSSNVINDASSLILRQADGTQSSWLDKSSSSGGYEGRNAAVNWKPIADKFYYQISFNATDYTDITVQASMLYNYNAYAKQLCEYSIDGENFTQIGSIDLVNAKTYYDGIFTLPSDADNAGAVYIRWIPDYNSNIIGTPASNDGTAISSIYVFGTESVFNDGVAPILVNSVPDNNAIGASATGKVVFNFDERVKIADNTTATLNGENLIPVVFGKSISFNYSGLDYNTQYTFELAGNVVSDLTDNILVDAISISFTTLNKPTVTKKVYDFIVGVDGDFAAALVAAQTASSSGERFFIFFPDGEYDLGNTTGDATQQTYINLPNVSFIGQSADGVILFNEPLAKDEGIGTTPTINFQSNSKNIYMQDLSILNKMDYRKGTFTGRAVALRDQGDKNIYKNVKLLSNQDTFYTGSNRIYLENSEIHGTVDFIFGGGDVFFNACTIYLEDRGGNHVTAAATGSNWGYVFRDCTIDGFPQTNGTYKLGRPWQNSPKTVFINTIMNVLPANEGWSEWGAAPSVYAEYNSITSSGVSLDLSGRRTTYNYTNGGGGTVMLNPVLTSVEAETYTIENVLTGTDTWQPKLATEQAAIPVLSNKDSTLTWEEDDYVLGWAVFKDDVFVDFVTTNSFDISGNISGVYSIRSANGMGGLSAKSNKFDAATLGQDKNTLVLRNLILSPNPTRDIIKLKIEGTMEQTFLSLYNLTGQKLWFTELIMGNNDVVSINLNQFSKGVYLLKIERGSVSRTMKIAKQ